LSEEGIFIFREGQEQFKFEARMILRRKKSSLLYTGFGPRPSKRKLNQAGCIKGLKILLNFHSFKI
jgi:hypothetical protein